MRLDDTRKILFAGFLVVAACMVLLAAVSLGVVSSSVQRLEQVVYTNNQKVELLTRMRTVARERTVSLQNMLLQADSFRRDETWLEFNEFGNEFVRARQVLLAMNLTPAERELIEGPSSLIGAAGPVQHRVATLIFEGKRDQALDLLSSKAIPLQNAIFESMSDVMEAQQIHAQLAADEVELWYRRGVLFVLLVVVAALVVCAAIARYVMRHIFTSEKNLQQQKERAEVTLHSIGDGVVVTDAAGRIEQLNAAAEYLLKLRTEDAVGVPVVDVLHLNSGGGSSCLHDPIRKVLHDGEVNSSDIDSTLLTSDGYRFPVEYTAAPIYDSERHISGAVLVFRDVSESRALSEQLEYQALHDSLTGLVNRREIEARLKQALAESRRYTDEQYWLCYIDLDQFKVINDTCGHMAGDALLKQVADLLSQEVRETDLVARMGGDEFAILLKRCAAENVRPIVERIRSSLESKRFAWEDKTFNNTASIGLVSLQEGYGTLYDLMSAADAACYMAKERGRNRVVVYQRDDDAIVKMEGEMQWVSRINQALEEGRFVLYYQLIAPLKPGDETFRCEIMVRMRDVDGKLVPPMAFIPAAERYNRMMEIDRWVVRNALAFFAASGLQKFSVSINLSAQSLGNEAFLDFLVHELDRHALNPHCVCFEITETSAIANLSRATQLINSVRAKGCRFSLDDFGSGLSSFGYLKNLPVDYLKIDGSFVRDILDDPIDKALVESINQVGHILGMQTIAEYVENDEIRALLSEMGVDYGQGYGIAKPAPIEELLMESSVHRRGLAS